MTQASTSEQLEQKLIGLLTSINPSSHASPSSLSDVLTHGDEIYLNDLFGSSETAWEQGLCPLAPTHLLECIADDESTRLELVQSDIEFMNSVLQTCDDQQFEGAFGLRSVAFPIKLKGSIVHCIWVRHYLVRPMADSDIDRIARSTGNAADRIRQMLTPILSEPQEKRILDTARIARDAFQAATEQHLHAGDMIQQLVQSERTRSLGMLSGGIAHRFNNLLSVILGYSSFVSNREDLSPEANNALHKISDAAQQGRRLTEEILSFVGSEAEQVTDCHVHQVLNSILPLLQSQASSRVHIESALTAATDAVAAPPSAIHQLVFNLLTNAFDSMPDGGKLTISSSNIAEQNGDVSVQHLVLAIRDSGGTKPEGFEVERAGSGMVGIRMSQALGISISLSGSLTITSESQETTCVELRIPVSTQQPTKPPSPPPMRRIVPARIWVVDDNSIFRDMCSQVLSDEGHTVELIPSGRELLEHWKNRDEDPEVIIIDFSMPQFNGLELCSWLREEGSQVPIILVSGFSETQPDIHRALQMRRTHFLRKPFSFREILDIVTVALGETFIGDG